ncbi:MAG: tetratricopeptide repeat protein, partial [Flavobacteriaceae bacterium]
MIRSIHSFTQKITFISPYLLGMLLFLIIYVRLCSNDSNIDGDAHFNNGQYAEALESYNEYLMLHPHHIKTLYNRGRCYDELSQHHKAFVDYEAVLSRDPDNVKALVSLSKFYYRTENYEAAANLSSRAAMVEEDNYLAHYHKARACHKLGWVGDALDAYNETIELNPDFGFAYFQRSSILISIGLHPFGCYDLKVAANLNV